ncbi:MAG: WbqC family protein [Candidatus Omnitrophica bacterium]|nr:WbqC family protein [Candidatus Omnitrophota bacterium]
MKIAIHQPQYLPWLGYFDKMDNSDVFVLLDDVQYKKNEWQNRNKIRTAPSWQWLTVPVIFEHGQKINEITIDNHRDWRSKHLRSFEMNYSRSPYYEDHIGFFRDSYTKDWNLLVDINDYFIEYLKKALGINTELVKASSLKITSTGTERLIDICKVLKADTYLAGSGSADYMDAELFKKNGIKTEVQEFSHPKYKQVFAGFEPYMSAVDLLFSSGKDSLKIIREGRK